MKHVLHCDDFARVPLIQVLVEGICVSKKGSHICHLVDDPTIDISIKGVRVKKHVHHVVDLGSVPRRNIAIKRLRIEKHAFGLFQARRAPRQVLVKDMSVLKHIIGVLDFRHVPVSNGLIKGTGIVEHAGRFEGIGEIPTVEWFIEFCIVGKEPRKIRHILGTPSADFSLGFNVKLVSLGIGKLHHVGVNIGLEFLLVGIAILVRFSRFGRR